MLLWCYMPPKHLTVRVEDTISPHGMSILMMQLFYYRYQLNGLKSRRATSKQSRTACIIHTSDIECSRVSFLRHNAILTY